MSIRNQFPILANYTYLNTARYCALPQSVIDIQKEFLNHVSNDGSWNFSKWSETYENTRDQSSKLIGVNIENTFFLPNVSFGFNIAAQYLPKRKVICLKGDFPSVNMVWEPHGFEVQYIDYQANDFEDRLNKELHTPNLIVSISWIQSADGFEIDLESVFALCKEYGHFLILDGTQGVGAIPFHIDVDVDCLFLASGFKWLLAGYGVTVAYASEKILQFLRPMRGWNSGFLPSGNIINEAKSLEVGNATYLNVAALGEGLKLINNIGIEAICEHNLVLKSIIESRLEENKISFHKYNTRSSILKFESSEDLFDRMKTNRIQVTDNTNSIRVSPHFYNNAEDIEKMLEVIS